VCRCVVRRTPLRGERGVVAASDGEAGEVGGVEAGCTYECIDFCFFAISRYDCLLVGQHPFVLMGQTSIAERTRTSLVTLTMLILEKFTLSSTNASKNPGPGVSLRHPGLQLGSSISYSPCFLASFVFIFSTIFSFPSSIALVPGVRQG